MKVLVSKILFTIFAILQVALDTFGIIANERIIPFLSILAIVALIGIWMRRYFGFFFYQGYFFFLLAYYVYTVFVERSASSIIQFILTLIIGAFIYKSISDDYSLENDGWLDKAILKLISRKKRILYVWFFKEKPFPEDGGICKRHKTRGIFQVVART